MFTAKRKGLLAFFAVLLTVALISCAVIFALPEKNSACRRRTDAD